MTNWLPIEKFNADAFEGEEFLVAIKLPAQEGGTTDFHTPFIAQWEPDRDEDGEPSGEPRFQGEWRHVDGWENCEPAAFAEIDPYEPDEVEGELAPVAERSRA
jgi:hypothetical protein